MLRKWAVFSMNLKEEKSTRQKTFQNVSEVGIFQPRSGSAFSTDPDPDRPKTGGSGSETLN